MVSQSCDEYDGHSICSAEQSIHQVAVGKRLVRGCGSKPVSRETYLTTPHRKDGLPIPGRALKAPVLQNLLHSTAQPPTIILSEPAICPLMGHAHVLIAHPDLLQHLLIILFEEVGAANRREAVRPGAPRRIIPSRETADPPEDVFSERRLLLQQPRSGHLDNSKELRLTTWLIQLFIPLMSSWLHDTNGTQTTWSDSLPPDQVSHPMKFPRVPHDQSTSRCAHYRLHCSKRCCFAHGVAGSFADMRLHGKEANEIIQEKIPKLVWRGVTWTNLEVRGNLVEATRDKSWADLNSLWHVGYLLDDFYGILVCSRVDRSQYSYARRPDSTEPPQLSGLLPFYVPVIVPPRPSPYPSPTSSAISPSSTSDLTDRANFRPAPFVTARPSASSTLNAMAIVTNPPRRESAPARIERSDHTGSATNPNERTHLLLSLVHHRNEQSLQECPTLQRVEKQTRQRVRWACERCRASLVQNEVCPECEHKRCTQCVRDPPYLLYHLVAHGSLSISVAVAGPRFRNRYVESQSTALYRISAGEMDQSRQSAANPPDKGGVARPEASGPSAPTQLDAGVQFREVRAVYSNLQYLKDLCWWRNPGRAMERGRAAPAFDRWP
ncbi:hypothetical protein L1887_56330 [Cichorium endivia]|nr:hypothetical protein L1887_56330 [Cichorium endivia]